MASIIKTSMECDVSKNMESAIEAYKTTCVELYSKVQNELTTLSAGFQGDAAKGFDKYTKDVEPILTTNLTGEANSVCTMLTSIAKLVQQLDPHDQELGETNQSASGVSAGNAAGASAE